MEKVRPWCGQPSDRWWLKNRTVLFKVIGLITLALLKQLHYLPIEWHIWFDLATLTFKTLHTNRPPYLTDRVQYYQPARYLRSSGSHQLVIPRRTCHWDLMVSVSLHHISRIHSQSTFAKSSQFLLLGVTCKLTSFSQLFLPPSDPPANAPWFF